jgi:hypothetical protein
VDRPSNVSFAVSVVLALLLGGVTGYLIGEKRGGSARVASAGSSNEEGRRSGGEDKRSHTNVVPQNPNTMGGTFNPAQAAGASGGGAVQPGAGGGTSEAPTSSAGQSGN